MCKHIVFDAKLNMCRLDSTGGVCNMCGEAIKKRKLMRVVNRLNAYRYFTDMQPWIVGIADKIEKII